MSRPEHDTAEMLALNEIMHRSSELIQEIFMSYRIKQLSLTGSVAFSKKADGSVVTDLDREIERSVQKYLKLNFPNIPVYGEETGDEGIEATTFWLVDPIDGTESFINGTPTFTNMAALIHKGQAVAGIIYNPMSDNMFTAFRGQGAFKDGEPLNISNKNPLPVVLCKEELFSDVKNIFDDDLLVFETPPSGGGNGLALVAEGRVSARLQIRANGVAHDYAPGALIVEESGGVLVPISEDAYTYRSTSFVACHPLFAARVRQGVAALRNLERVLPY